jgi:MFS family permease
MVKAGLIGAAAGFIYITSLTLLHPFCTFCLTPLLGIGVGYLAGQFDKPGRPETSLSKGSIAGIIAGIGTILGQMLATVINGILITHSEQLPIIVHELGLPEFLATGTGGYWQALLITSSFCSLLNLGIITGLGAVGGLLAFRKQHRNLFSTISS